MLSPYGPRLQDQWLDQNGYLQRLYMAIITLYVLSDVR